MMVGTLEDLRPWVAGRLAVICRNPTIMAYPSHILELSLLSLLVYVELGPKSTLKSGDTFCCGAYSEGPFCKENCPEAFELVDESVQKTLVNVDVM